MYHYILYPNLPVQCAFDTPTRPGRIDLPIYQPVQRNLGHPQLSGSGQPDWSLQRQEPHISLKQSLEKRRLSRANLYHKR